MTAVGRLLPGLSSSINKPLLSHHPLHSFAVHRQTVWLAPELRGNAP
jgi:hypothetical protein